MNRLAYAAPVAILALLLAGCTSRGPGTSESASIKPVEQPYRAGTGVVQAVTPAPAPIRAGASSSAGSSAPAATSRGPTGAADSGLQRLRIRMDDGRMVYVDTPNRDFAPGTRVQLSEANEIRRQ